MKKYQSITKTAGMALICAAGLLVLMLQFRSIIV